MRRQSTTATLSKSMLRVNVMSWRFWTRQVRMNTSHFAFLPIHKVGVQINQKKRGPPAAKVQTQKHALFPLYSA